MPSEPVQSWTRSWIKSATSPLVFVTELLKAQPEPWQAEALSLVEKHDRVSIRAGHGVGKTTLEAWLALWFLLTRYPCKIPIVANSQDQLRDTIWPELRVWRSGLPEPLRERVVVDAERVTLRGAPDSFIAARTAGKDNPEALQGFHSPNLMFLIDEASGIFEKVFEVGQGALSTANAKAVMVGNPTRSEGFFYDTHHKLRSRWKTMRVSSLDVPRATGHVDDIIAKYGIDSNAHRVRVLGEFPRSDDDGVIPLELCEEAVARQVEPARVLPLWGIDVAMFGDDASTLCKRQGNVVLEPVKTWRNKDPMQLAGLIKQEWDDTPTRARPSRILVDSIGIGAGVVYRLQEMELPARGVNVAEAPSIRERYMRLRDDLWFRVRDWLMQRDCKLPDDPELIAELVGPRYKVESSGKIKVEGKADMKKRSLHSPDRADALCLTFAGTPETAAAYRYDPYADDDSPKSGWMVA